MRRKDFADKVADFTESLAVELERSDRLTAAVEQLRELLEWECHYRSSRHGAHADHLDASQQFTEQAFAARVAEGSWVN